MPVTWLSLNPLDTLSVRDGRSFAAGSDTTSTAVFPPPSTVAGAVHKALEGIGRSGPSANRFASVVPSINGMMKNG